MKKLLTLALAAVMLFSALPAAFAQNSSDGLVLDSMSALKVNAETGYIENLIGLTSVRELLTNFRNKNEVTVKDASGKVLASTDEVGTDAVISCGDDTLKTLVYGDVNRDCKINMKDISSMIRLLASYDVDIVETAMDVNFDGNRNMKDISAMIRYLAGWNVDIRNHDMLEPLTAPDEDEGIEILFDNIMNRVGATGAQAGDDYVYTAKTAKNEIETVEILVFSDEKKSGMTLEVSPVTDMNGNVLESEVLYGHYYDISIFYQLRGKDTNAYISDRYVDPLVPLNGSEFELYENEYKTFAVKIKTPIDAEAGLYKSTLNLKDAEGNTVKTAEFRVYVWDFALSEETACDTAFGLGGLGQSDYEYKYNFLLENRVSAYAIPYDITDSRADAYMSNPRVTSFVTYCPYYGGAYDATDAEIVAYYNKLRTNKEWLDKAYVYPMDEPGFDGVEITRERYEHLCTLLPEKDFQVVVPMAGNPYDTTNGVDLVSQFQEFVNIWCPQSYAFTPYYTYAQSKEDPYNYPSYGNKSWTINSVYEKYGQWKDRYEAFRERGDKMWWYICCSPEFPYANFFQGYQGVDIRMVFWQQYMFDIDGLLYWAVDFDNINDYNKVSLKKTNGGDGLLVYNGSLFGLDGLVSCIRFESVRDGIEDFQYLTQLEELTDRDTAMKYVDRITTGILQFTEDYTDIVNVRDELGFMIEELSASK